MTLSPSPSKTTLEAALQTFIRVVFPQRFSEHLTFFQIQKKNYKMHKDFFCFILFYVGDVEINPCVFPVLYSHSCF